MNARISKLILPTYGWFSRTRSHTLSTTVLRWVQFFLKNGLIAKKTNNSVLKVQSHAYKHGVYWS